MIKEEDITTILERFGIYNKLRMDYMCQPYNKFTILDANLGKKTIQSERPFFYLIQRGSWPEGMATLATCIFKNFKRERDFFERAIETFKKVFPFLDIIDPKEFGGYGNCFVGKPVFENDKYYVGEAAGLQDSLWGFGLRYAMTSGYLAARAIIENKDYEGLLKINLIPIQRASIVNRFIFARLGNKGYPYLINRLTKGDTVEKLRRHYNISFFKTILYPLARWNYKSRLVDKGCHDEDCTCVWCKCKKDEKAGIQI